MSREWVDKHPSHKNVRMNWDVKHYDFVCCDCGLTDLGTSGWGNLVHPCVPKQKQEERVG